MQAKKSDTIVYPSFVCLQERKTHQHTREVSLTTCSCAETKERKGVKINLWRLHFFYLCVFLPWGKKESTIFFLSLCVTPTHNFTVFCVWTFKVGRGSQTRYGRANIFQAWSILFLNKQIYWARKGKEAPFISRTLKNFSLFVVGDQRQINFSSVTLFRSITIAERPIPADRLFRGVWGQVCLVASGEGVL